MFGNSTLLLIAYQQNIFFLPISKKYYLILSLLRYSVVMSFATLGSAFHFHGINYKKGRAALFQCRALVRPSHLPSIFLCLQLLAKYYLTLFAVFQFCPNYNQYAYNDHLLQTNAHGQHKCCTYSLALHEIVQHQLQCFS
jgi:hypothetical protein